MVLCDFSLLLEVHSKIKNLMEWLKMIPQVDLEPPCEDGILTVILKELDKSILHIQNKQYTVSIREGGEYLEIEGALQRQEHLNRNFIRRELEFKEYQKLVMEELAQEKKTVKGLQAQLAKANQKVLAKDLEIIQLSRPTITVNLPKKKEIFEMEANIAEKKKIDPFKSMKDGEFVMYRRGRSKQMMIHSLGKVTKKKGKYQ